MHTFSISSILLGSCCKTCKTYSKHTVFSLQPSQYKSKLSTHIFLQSTQKEWLENMLSISNNFFLISSFGFISCFTLKNKNILGKPPVFPADNIDCTSLLGKGKGGLES